MKQFDREFDPRGIVLQKKEYQPLSIAFYGIMNYDLYKETGDRVYYNHIINQYKFFCDTSGFDLIDGGKGMGLPYNKDFKDIKAPWYSGMTQGVAISFLLRYYDLKKDKSALQKAKQLAYFMLRPVAEGGTIGKTPEGHPWIEEYPGSKSSPQVLNGFINALIGLKEYCMFFPKDSLASRLHDTCYKAMIKSFEKYDVHDWTRYNRAYMPCSNQYIRYQITQLEHLYKIYGDETLLKQMMLWSMFTYNKPDPVLKFYKNTMYNFAIPMSTTGDPGMHYGPASFDSTFSPLPDVRVSSSEKRSGGKQIPAVLMPQKKTILSLGREMHFVRLVFDSLPAPGELVFELPGANGKTVAAETRIHANGVDIYAVSKFSRVHISYNNDHATPVRLKEVQFNDPDRHEQAMFLFSKHKLIVKLDKGKKYAVRFKSKNAPAPVVFYRHLDNKFGLYRAVWKASQTISNPEMIFTAPANGHYEFFVSLPLLLPGAGISELELVPVE
ncbi:MAG: D-glucuronyl C5-epimerase [Bacteroidetes bacterium]|nr:MAG: D-glucuronyl C5-epimerase [Bacteroidota bacterium]